MKIENGAVVLEQVSWPGSVGDSAAESGRYDNLCAKLGLKSPIELAQFFTSKGMIRHPSLADYKDEHGNSWAEDDFTSDQAGPLYLAASSQLAKLYIAREVKTTIIKNNWRTGNGNLVAVPLFAELESIQWLKNWSIRGQAFLFSLPFRWSDSENKFEPMGDSSADYLNFFHYALKVPQELRRKVPAEKLIEKIDSYYSKEPNSKTLVDMYHAAILRYW